MELPIRVDTQSNLGQQFGYAPDYECNIPAFDPGDIPILRSRDATQDATGWACTYSADSWTHASFLTAIRHAYPGFIKTVNGGGWMTERIESDSRGRAYTIVQIQVEGERYYDVLLYSLNGCVTWRLVTLPFGGQRVMYGPADQITAALEQYGGWNVTPRPPLVAVWRAIADVPGKWAARHELYVLEPYFSGTRLVLPRPTLVTDRYLGGIYAAGGPSIAASDASTAWIVWPGVGRWFEPGTPINVDAFDFRSHRITSSTVVAFARPRNDAHDTSGIVRDGNGYLHVLTGAHDSTFFYTHSISPFDATSWTAPETVLNDGFVKTDGTHVARQTYVSLACLPDNSLEIAFRQNRRGVDADFDGRSYDALCVQHRTPDGLWTDALPVVCALDRPGYVNYYQKMAADYAGRLYLSLSLFAPTDYPVEERPANRYQHRMLLISKDGGSTWEFACDADFDEGIVLSER